MRAFSRTTLLICLGLLAGVSAVAGPNSQHAAREDAVALARSGNFDEALLRLGILRAAHPEDPLILFDETVVLVWAGEERRALENAAGIDLKAAPDLVVRSVARSARNLGEFEYASKAYRTLLEHDDADLDARRGLAMTEADAGRFEMAWAALKAAPAAQQDDTSLILTEAYLLERERRYLEALGRYQQVAEAEPENHAALRGQALMLRAVLLPKQALALARTHPGILDAEEIMHLEADISALKVRRSANSYYPVSRRHEGTDAALASIDAMLESDGLSPATALRLRFDRIVALSNRLLMAEAIRDFEMLNVDDDVIPAYVLAAAGRAYLSQREPETARRLLEMALARDPENVHIKFQLFFAYADLGMAERASQLAEDLMATLPQTNRIPGSRVVKGNKDYLRATIMYGLAQAYFDQYDESQEHFENLLKRAPHNTDIRHELANVFRWRGWLDRSLSEYSQVLTAEPELLAARVGHAHARLDNQDFERVEQELVELDQYFGDEPSVKNLARRWQVHNSQEFVTEVEFGESSGSTFGSDQYTIDASWYSKPLARRFRAMVFTHEAYASFEEGDAHRQRIGSGVEYRHIRWLASARLSASTNGDPVGFRGNATYRFSDSWNFGALIETESNATLLRGQRVGISSNLAGVNVAYRKHESAHIAAELSFQDLSDQNTVMSFALRGQQRLINWPRSKLTLTGEAAAENRDRDDVAYFSPRRSSVMSVGLRFDWMMKRRYDLGLTHTFAGNLGQYEQTGFDADSIWSFDYRFLADLSDRFSWHVGFSRRSNLYDGNREYATFFTGGIRWKF